MVFICIIRIFSCLKSQAKFAWKKNRSVTCWKIAVPLNFMIFRRFTSWSTFIVDSTAFWTQFLSLHKPCWQATVKKCHAQKWMSVIVNLCHCLEHNPWFCFTWVSFKGCFKRSVILKCNWSTFSSFAIWKWLFMNIHFRIAYSCSKLYLGRLLMCFIKNVRDFILFLTLFLSFHFEFATIFKHFSLIYLNIALIYFTTYKAIL